MFWEMTDDDRKELQDMVGAMMQRQCGASRLRSVLLAAYRGWMADELPPKFLHSISKLVTLDPHMVQKLHQEFAAKYGKTARHSGTWKMKDGKWTKELKEEAGSVIMSYTLSQTINY